MRFDGFKAVFAAVLLAFVFFLLPSSPSAKESITVAGAADLAFAFREIAGEFERETGVKVVLTLGSTGMLTTQIANGAPFDAFFAASSSYIDRLDEGGFVISDTVEFYAYGRIVLAVNKRSGVAAVRLEELASPRIKWVAIANPEHAPYGVAAMEAFKAAGLWDVIKPKLVYGENVRQALQFIQTGNAQAGIVALSIADVPEVNFIIIDQKLHNPIRQAAAVVKSTKNERAARAFIKFVNGAKGRPVMERYGFKIP